MLLNAISLTTLTNLALGQQPPPSAFNQKVVLNIPSQRVDRAIRLLGQQSGLTIMVESRLAGDIRSPALIGSFTAAEALRRILPKQLHAEYLDDNTIAVLASNPPTTRNLSAPIRVASASGLPDMTELTDSALTDSAIADAGGHNSASTGEGSYVVNEVVVTGTRIRDADVPMDPVLSFDRKYIEGAGYSTTEDLVRSIPQNFGGGATGSSPDGFLGAGANAQSNSEAATGVNLRGLGTGSTLVLLDGHRMAPAQFGGVVDVSVIPLSAIDRVEVLTDGASAVYGADAVGGVVNFILRNDYNGAETMAHYGSVTQGGAHDELIAQTIGHTWESGGILANLQYRHQSPLMSGERVFTRDLPQPTDIYPGNDKYSGLLRIHQYITPNLRIFGDALLSDNVVARDYSPNLSNSSSSKTRNTSTNYTAGVEFKPSERWRLEISGTSSRQGSNVTFSKLVPPQLDFYPVGTKAIFNTDRLRSGDIALDGPLVSLPGGAVKLAVGGELRTETFTSYLPAAQPPYSLRSFSRHIKAGFGELRVPVVGNANSIPGVRILELSAALRHDHYSDFGGTTNGKYAILWSPIASLNIRVSHGESFRPPNSYELINQAAGIAIDTSLLTAPNGTDVVPTLLLTGVNNHLGPETSENWSAGFDFQPVFIPGARLTLDYFRIRYTNRIIVPPYDGDVLQKPSVYGSLITPLPTDSAAAAYVDNLVRQGATFYDDLGTGTAGVRYAYDLETLNASRVLQTGWDIGVQYRMAPQRDELSFGVNTALINTINTQLTPTSQATDLVNTYGNPLRVRLRSDLTWTRGPLTTNLAWNFSNRYRDTSGLIPTTIGSFSTVDITARYAPSELRGFSIGIAAINVLNRRPPYIAGESIGLPGVHYDVGNADPRQRIIGVDLRKTW